MSPQLHHRTKDIRLIFVRHGETESNAERRYMGHEDSPLSALGRAQAAAVASRLAREDIDAIYSSDLGRAAATADAIAEACGLRRTLDERLRERHAGVFQGLRLSKAQEMYPEHFAAQRQPSETCSIPGGESALQLQARFTPFLEEICCTHIGGIAAVVTHGGLIRTLLWHFLGSQYASAHRARVDNTSLSVFRCEEDSWILEAWNDTAHLLDR